MFVAIGSGRWDEHLPKFMILVGMQVMARITGLVGMFLGNSRRSEWFTSVVVGLLWACGRMPDHNLQAYILDC